MAKIIPFKATRPTRDKSSLVATRSYLSYSKKTLKEKLENNPYTFLHVINPDYSNKENKVKGKKKFSLIKKKFNDFINENIFIQDKIPTLYLYQQKMNDIIFNGIICGSSIDDYLNGKIKIHEQTIAHREEMFKDYLDITGFNAEPILLTYPSKKEINDLIDKYLNTRPEYEFTTTNRSSHKLWLIQNKSDINKFQDSFKKINNLYISDGHHRLASSALLCLKKRKENPNFSGKENFNYCMSFLIAENQINILSYNRIVKDLNGLSINKFIELVSKKYLVKKQSSQFIPKERNEIGMYLDGNWYSLIFDVKSFNKNDCVDKLDPVILSKNILDPILNIKDLRTNHRVDFIDGKLTSKKIEEYVDNGKYSVAFLLKPIKVSDIKEVADKNKIMPPKSTYVEPKLRSGLIIYNIEE
tara:strand:+ start:146 stop:1387 length:1242 start_codon:yes stop_codon:yes gene_type:complete